MISSSSTFRFILFWRGLGVAVFFLPPGCPFFSSQSPCLYHLRVTHISSQVPNTHSDCSISFTYPVLWKLDLESTHCSSFQPYLFYYFWVTQISMVLHVLGSLAFFTVQKKLSMPSHMSSAHPKKATHRPLPHFLAPWTSLAPEAVLT